MAYFVIFKLGLKPEPENVGQVVQLPEPGIYWNRAHAVKWLVATSGQKDVNFNIVQSLLSTKYQSILAHNL